MLRRSARKSGQAPPEDSPTVSPQPPKRGRGGGRGRGRGRGKSAAESVAAEDANMDETAQDDSQVDESSFDEPTEAPTASSPIMAEAAATSVDQEDVLIDRPASNPPPPHADEQQSSPTAPASDSDQKEESFNSDDRSDSRNEERSREEGEERRDEGRRRWQDRPEGEERNDDYRGDGRRRRRSRSREEYDDDYDDRRRGRGGGYRHGGYGGGGGGGYNNDGGYGGGGGGGGYGRQQWGYGGRGRGRGGDGGFRGGGGWRGRGNFGGPGGPPPGMMGPPPGWDNSGYDPMGGPPMPMMMGMRGPPPPPHFGMHGPPGMPPMPPPLPHHLQQQQHDQYAQQHPHGPPLHGVHPSPMMGPPGMGPPGGMGLPPGMVPPPPPLPLGPPPPPAPTAEMENVKTEEEMAAMKEQIARQIAEARERAQEGREQEEKKQREKEKEEETSEDKEKRVKQASAMLRGLFRSKTTTAAAAAASSKQTAPTAVHPATAATVATVGGTTSVSTPQPVPPPSASASLSIASSLGNSGGTPKVSPRKPETRDVFGKDDEGGLFGDRKTTLSLPTAADRAEMQLYNDVLNAPHPNQDMTSPRKGPAAVPPPPISTPAIVVSKPPPDSASRRDEHSSRERRSRSRSGGDRGGGGHRGEERSPRRDRTPHDSKSPARRTPRGGSRSPRRSPRSSPRRGEKERERERTRRSRSRSHGRHRSSRSRSKDRGGGGRTRQDSGHHRERRGASPVREQRAAQAARRRGYELSPVRSSGGRSSNRSARRSSKSPKRERSKSRERRRSRTPVSHRTRRGKEDERERRRSGGDGRDERRRKEERKDSIRSKENGEGSGDEGKENSSPGHDEDEIDKAIEMDDDDTVVEKRRSRSTAAAISPSIGREKKSPRDATVPVATRSDQPRPEPFEEIAESIFLTQIKDGNDYGGVCFCEDGECGVSCVMRYLTVECGRRCPSGEKCTNRAMQKKGGAKVEVYHTGSEKGFGVRALEPIKKGGFIIEYIGEVVTQKAGEKRKKLYAREFPTRRHHYLMTVTDSKNRPFIIDATKFGNSSRFLNHSCEPNAFCDKWSVQRRFRMGFFAKRNIEPGEEITFDYRFQNYGRQLIECACGAPSCRRYLSSKDQAKEAEERLKSGQSESPSDDTEEDEEEDEEEEEEEEMEMKDEDRRKLRKQQTINEEAERLLKKGILTRKGQYELLSAIMIRLTPAHQPLRTRLLRLLTASAEKNNEVYRIFLQKNGRTILEKYLTLGVDEDTSVCQYRELIPLMEALLELLDGIKRYTETTRETSVMANLVPILRLISAQCEVPDSLIVYEVLHDIISGIEEETTDDEEEGEWTKRWTQCTSRAAELAETWQIVYGVRTFKIPKKQEERRGSDAMTTTTMTVKSSLGVAPSVSMIRPAAFTRTIKTESVKGWQQSSEKKEWRGERDNSRDWKDSSSSFSKDRFSSSSTTDRSSGGGYRKRKWEEDSAPTERREERREYGGYRKEEERRREETGEKKIDTHSATNSLDTPGDEEEDAMQISPNLDEVESERDKRTGEPVAKKAALGVYSPLPDASSQSVSTRSDPRPPSPPPPSQHPAAVSTTQHHHHHHQHPHQHHQQHQHHQEAPGAMPGPLPPPLGTTPAWGWNPAAAAGGVPQWGMGGYGGYPNGMPPVPTHALSYFNLAPAPGSSLTAELVFWQGGAKYCQQRADEIAHRLGQAAELEQQMQMLHHTEGAEAAPLPPPMAMAVTVREEKPVRPNLNDRLEMMTGVPIKSGGGTPILRKESVATPSAPRPPSRPTDEELAAARDVRTKDGRLLPISSIAKYCKVRTATSGVYYYNKFTRSPTWILPDGEEANSDDEVELGPTTTTSTEAVTSAESVVTGMSGGSGAASASASRSSTTTKTPVKGQPQTPPEENTDQNPSYEMDEKEKLLRKSEFKTRSGELLKRYVKASMFTDVDEFKKTLRKIIHGCIEKEQKMNPRFDFLFSDDVKHRMVEYTKKYVQRHKLKPLSYPEGIAD